MPQHICEDVLPGRVLDATVLGPVPPGDSDHQERGTGARGSDPRPAGCLPPRECEVVSVEPVSSKNSGLGLVF